MRVRRPSSRDYFDCRVKSNEVKNIAAEMNLMSSIGEDERRRQKKQPQMSL
jgi:hypothetical protein